MNNIKADLLVASKNSVTRDVLYTWVLTFPRMILAEVNTHRMFSRNTSSSRAIPSHKIRKNILDDPFIPRYIGANKAGMQAGAELAGWRRWTVKNIWSISRLPQVAAAWSIERLGGHKQVANRLLEPWVWTQQLLSATEVENFFWLRDHHMAEPHFQDLARQMHRDAKRAQFYFDNYGETASVADHRLQVLQPGEWHLPFITHYDKEHRDLEQLKKISVARCARTSYFLPENGEKSDWKRDAELFNRLAVRDDGSNDPRHLSPLEHQAKALEESVYVGNFRGFGQFRKEITNEAGPTSTAHDDKDQSAFHQAFGQADRVPASGS
jgi:hypothetical protein